MLFLFAGSSSIRQFHHQRNGMHSFTAFPGASIKGLLNDRSVTGHGAAIHHLAGTPGDRVLLVMLGNVDLDFTFYRHLLAGPDVSESDFLALRVEIYRDFVTGLIDAYAAAGELKRICILGPQLTPLRGEEFFIVTAGHAGMRVASLRALAERVDVSLAARHRRTLRFNDMLQAGLPAHPLVRLFRIDQHMLDGRGGLQPEFYPASSRDHHAAQKATVRLWHRQLRDEVPVFDEDWPRLGPPGIAKPGPGEHRLAAE
jgi:hypothetical protein